MFFDDFGDMCGYDVFGIYNSIVMCFGFGGLVLVDLDGI